MKRSTVDKLVSSVGLTVAAVLIAAGGLLTWANTFVAGQVHDQLAAQKIFFPPKGSEAIAGPEFKDMQQYAGQQLTTGAQAKVYANSFIGVHLKEVADGQTYAQLSAKAQQNKDDQVLAGQVATMFKGETLRGLLLNAYAFGTMATLAGIAAIVSFVAAGVILVLSALGLVHARRAGHEAVAGPTSAPRQPVTV